MARNRIITSLLGLTTVSIAVAGLAGCSVIEEAVYQRHSSTFADAAAMRDGNDLALSWVPSDATDIQLVESTREGASDAAVLLVSGDALDPAECAEIDRQSGPMLNIETGPDPYAMQKAFACGAWTVVPSDDGWYGWTPNHPDEQAQSPK